MQNFVAFPAYLSRKEWDELSRYSADWRAVCNIFVRVLLERLLCINPSEPTKKKVTAFALYMTLHHVQQEMGSFAFEEFKTTLKEYVVNQFKGKRKGKKDAGWNVATKDFIKQLPENPEDLREGDYDHLYDKFKIEGCFVTCPVPQTDIQVVDDSLKCRGNGSANPGQDMFTKLLGMQRQVMHCLADKSSEDSQDCPIQLLGKRWGTMLPIANKPIKRKSSVHGFFLEDEQTDDSQTSQSDQPITADAVRTIASVMKTPRREYLVDAFIEAAHNSEPEWSPTIARPSHAHSARPSPAPSAASGSPAVPIQEAADLVDEWAATHEVDPSRCRAEGNELIMALMQKSQKQKNQQKEKKTFVRSQKMSDEDKARIAEENMMAWGAGKSKGKDNNGKGCKGKPPTAKGKGKKGAPGPKGKGEGKKVVSAAAATPTPDIENDAAQRHIAQVSVQEMVAAKNSKGRPAAETLLDSQPTDTALPPGPKGKSRGVKGVLAAAETLGESKLTDAAPPPGTKGKGKGEKGMSFVAEPPAADNENAAAQRQIAQVAVQKMLAAQNCEGRPSAQTFAASKPTDTAPPPSIKRKGKGKKGVRSAAKTQTQEKSTDINGKSKNGKVKNGQHPNPFKPFQLFAKEMRPKIKVKDPVISNSDMMKLIGKLWHGQSLPSDATWPAASAAAWPAAAAAKSAKPPKRLVSATAGASAAAAVQSAAKKSKPQKPLTSHEMSRNQWLARSALDGSKTFKYGCQYEYPTAQEAEQAAKRWLGMH